MDVPPPDDDFGVTVPLPPEDLIDEPVWPKPADDEVEVLGMKPAF
jgi:hypothetical protein